MTRVPQGEPITWRDYNQPHRVTSDRRTHQRQVSDCGSPGRVDDHARHRGRLLVVHLRSDLGPAASADRADRSEPQGLAAASAPAKRSEPARAGDARHAGHQRALSTGRVVGSIRPHPPRSGRRAEGGGEGRECPPDTRSGRVPGDVRGSILGRREPHLRSGPRRARGGGAGPDPAVASGATGGAQYRCRAAARPNNATEEQTAQQAEDIRTNVKQVYRFLAATLAAIAPPACTDSIDRRLFAQRHPRPSGASWRSSSSPRASRRYARFPASCTTSSARC